MTIDTENKLADIIEIPEFNVEKKIHDFGELLQTIESMDDKKRALWREIYENALIDRQNAYAMFTRLVRIAKEISTEHAVHGRTIATFLERMGKANDQLIRLAELIAKAQTTDDEIDPDDMFNEIKKNEKGR